MGGLSSPHRSARSSRFPKSVACITATSGGQRHLRTTSPRRLLLSFCRTFWVLRDLVGKAGSGDADCGPRSSLQRLEPLRRARTFIKRAGPVLAKDSGTSSAVSSSLPAVSPIQPTLAGARPVRRSSIRVWPGRPRGSRIGYRLTCRLFFPGDWWQRGVVGVQPSSFMPFGKVVPLTYKAIRLILDRNTGLAGSGPTLPSSVVRALETALRGPLIATDSYQVALPAEDATALVSWCREVAQASSPRDAAILRVAAAVIEGAP